MRRKVLFEDHLLSVDKLSTRTTVIIIESIELLDQ